MHVFVALCSIAYVSKLLYCHFVNLFLKIFDNVGNNDDDWSSRYARD